MAGMFYTFEEVKEKLNMTDKEVKELIKEGKLREFRDGSKILFNISEVSMLAGTSQLGGSAMGGPEVDLVPDETNETPEQQEQDEFNLDNADETSLSNLSKADTNIGTTGINILGDTDDQYQLSSDSKGETKIDDSSIQLSGLDSDINLDSVGSGSGLLDLSLQADDTSLGAVLDDILPTGPEGNALPAAASGEASSLAEEADKIFEHTEPEDATQAAGQQVVVQQYAEPEADSVSNACGYALFIPLLAMLYATIVLSAGFKNIVPSILKGLQGIIWYIVIGLAMLSFCIIGIAAIFGGKTKKKQNKNVYQQMD